MRVSVELAKVSGALRCQDLRDYGNCAAYRLGETADQRELREIRMGQRTPSFIPSLYQIVQYGKAHPPRRRH